MIPLRAVCLAVLVGCSERVISELPVTKTELPPTFWEHWGDGRAEISGYQLVQPRYGHERTGEAVLVYVTETFTDATRVKSDGGHDDEYPVMKLNDMRDFQTGFYDYHAMTSTFASLAGERRVGQPVKVSFSMQEWCGQVYAQWVNRPPKLEETLHSYWDGEADRSSEILVPSGAVFADVLPILVRELSEDFVEVGEKVEVPFLERMLDSRLSRRIPVFQRASIGRSPAVSMATAMGELRAETVRVEIEDGTWVEYFVETTGERRLLGWQTSSGERASITGSMRSPYWKQSGVGQEALREQIGLRPK